MCHKFLITILLHSKIEKNCHKWFFSHFLRWKVIRISWGFGKFKLTKDFYYTFWWSYEIKVNFFSFFSVFSCGVRFLSSGHMYIVQFLFIDVLNSKDLWFWVLNHCYFIVKIVHKIYPIDTYSFPMQRFHLIDTALIWFIIVNGFNDLRLVVFHF